MQTRPFTLLTIILFFSFFAIAQHCPKSGDAKTPEKKKLNILKNAGVHVSTARIPEELSLNKLITTKKRKDRALFMDGAYVVTEGYLISFEEEGGESCNCQKAKKNLKNGDVHMYVGLKKMHLKKTVLL